MKALWRAFRYECNAFLHCKGALSIFIVGILFYSILYPLPYMRQVPQKLPLYAVDEDHSSSSRSVLRNVGATEGVRLIRSNDVPAAVAALRSAEAAALLVIPREFERHLLRGEPTVAPLYMDAAHLLIYRTVLQSVRQTLEAVGAVVRAEKLERLGVPAYVALSAQTGGRPDVRVLYNPVGNYATNTVPPVFILILQEILLIGSSMLAVRHANAPRSRAIDSPIFLVGRTLFTRCLFAVFSVYYRRILPVTDDLLPLARFGEAMIFLLPFFLGCAAIGNILGRFITEEVLVLPALLPLSLPLLFLSGFVWPTEAMPTAFSALAQLVPSTPAITGYMLMAARGARLAELLSLWGQLWGLALLYFSLAWLVVLLRAHSCNTDVNMQPRSI